MYKHHFAKTNHANVPINYERFFVPVIGRPLAVDLVEQADLQVRQNVLDVACGTGIVARLAYEKVGTDGCVSGLDINPGMLAVARSVSEFIDWHEAGAEAIPIPEDTFNVVFCQMGLQFMEDKAAALKEMRRVLAPGGYLFINVPGPIAEPFVLMADALKNYIGEKAAGFVSSVFSLYDSDEIKELASRAGFRNIQINTYKKELHLPKIEEFLWQYIQSTPLADVVSEADEASCMALEKNVAKRWQSISENGSVVYAQPMVTMAAQK
jgi:ubiquinone/menaquinone biosynthesis C-methylase UbiE